MLDLAVPAAPPPTKTPRDENFPVASRLLAPGKREAVLAFYGFVRAADDVADSPDLSPDAKLRRLDGLEAALLAGDPAEPLAARLHAADRAHGAGVAEARRMLGAFRQDASRRRYPDWAALLAYCAVSANPVGRFLLRLHGEPQDAEAPSDALCTALQLLNHLQDLGRDRRDLDRVYLPEPWMRDAGGEERFFEPGMAAARRPVLDAALDRVDALVDEARILPERLRDGRLRLQARATLSLAEALARRLRASDPLEGRVEVSRGDAARALAGALAGAALRTGGDAAVTGGIVARSGSSFRLGMSSLKGERRRAIHAVYAFCRLADDIADGAAPAAEKRRFLDGLRREIDRLSRRPETPVGRELARACAAFALPPGELHALVDGMETDSADRVRLPDDAALDLYARRVAGSVGALSIRIFGAPEAEDFALGLGRTLQLVNILRDVDEDADRDRLYLPLSRLGVPEASARVMAAHPRFAEACSGLAREAREGFAAADAALAGLDRRALKPAILMMEGYRRILDRLAARGFAERGPRLRLTAADRFGLVTLALRGSP